MTKIVAKVDKLDGKIKRLQKALKNYAISSSDSETEQQPPFKVDPPPKI